MTIEKGKFVAPITVDEVNRFFSGRSWDLADVCLLAAINKWSLHKPIEHPTHALLTEEQIYASNCGLSIPLELEYDPVTLQAPWSYNRPRGGDKSPYRLADFNGYHHDAEVPITIQITTSPGFLDGYGNVNIKPKITGTVVINPTAEIDIRKMGYLDPDITGIYLKIERSDGKVFEHGVTDKGDVEYPFTDLISEAVYEIDIDATYDITLGLIKTNGNILGMDPEFGDTRLTGFVPVWKTTAEALGYTVKIEMYVVLSAKPRIYIKCQITNTNDYDIHTKIKLSGEWYDSTAPDNIKFNDNYPEEDITLYAGSTIYWTPAGLVVNDEGYAEIIDESGIGDNVAYRYTARVGATMSLDFVKDTVDYPDYQIIK